MAGHSHSHAHAAGDERTAYYLDQLFAVGASGSLAAVTIVLYQSNLLGRMLHPKFHIYVLIGGLVLLAVVAIRALDIAFNAPTSDQPATPSPPLGLDRSKALAPEPHSHGHGEASCVEPHGHSHGHGEALAPEPHSHSHSHAHSHAAPEGHAAHGDGHDHSWAPWRYVVLMLPVLLYFLVLSNPGFDKTLVEKPATPLDHIINFIIIFRSVVWEAMPFIVLGALIAGMLEELLPQRVLTAILPRHVALAVGAGGLLGLVFPMCECGIVPIMRRLLRKGLPLSCCIAYLLAGPIINVVVLLSTYAAFSGMENVFIDGKPNYQMGGFYMVFFRALLGYVTAVVTALIVEVMYRKYGNGLLTPLARPAPVADEAEEKAVEKRSLWQRISNISEVTLHDFVDITVFLILGAALAAGARMFISPERIAELGASNANAILGILLMMGLAIVLCLCSEADAFVAASLVALRPSAKLAFLVLGPMLDFKLYAMYTRIFRPRLILAIYVAVLAQVFAYSVAVHFIWEANAPSWITPRPRTMPVSEEEQQKISSRVATAFPLMLQSPHAGSAAAALGMLSIDPDETATEMTPLQLEGAAQTNEMRDFYDGRLASMTGLFSGDGRQFSLQRYKINCCAADATPVKVLMGVDPSSRETLPASQLQGKWVKVTGRIRFLKDHTGQYLPALIVTPTEAKKVKDLIEVVSQPPNPFLY